MGFEKATSVIVGMVLAAAVNAATLVIDEQLPAGEYILTPVVAPPVDSDADGVPDDVDDCPDEYGTEPDGCPLPPVDTDGDGLADDVDACPTEPAQTEDGCPLPPPVADGDIENAILAMAPAQHPTEARFIKIPGSEIDVLTRCDEFDYGEDILCYKSYNAFIDWTGGAWQWKDFEFVLPAGGGHADYWGNEVYKANLVVADGQLAVHWSRPIDPSPMVDPSCKNNPASGPLASHTYSSPTYINSRDEYVHGTTYTTTPDEPCQTYVNAGKGLWATDGTDWRQVVDGTQYGFNYGRACYLRNRDKLYYFTGGGSARHMIDPAQDYAVTPMNWSLGWQSNSGMFDTAADQNNEICYLYAKDRGVRGYADGFGGEVWRSTSPVLKVPSLSVEHSTGNLVIVGGDGYAMHIDVATGEELDISATDGSGIPVTTYVSEYLYGKFDMIEPLPCVGIGVGDAREGVYLMTLPANVCTMGVEAPSEPPVVTVPEPPQEISEFLQSCLDTEGAVLCDAMSAGSNPYAVKNGLAVELENPNGSIGTYVGDWWRRWRGGQSWGENAVAEFDNQMNAVRLTKTDKSPSSGLWRTAFSPDASVAFGEGDTFTVQFQFRYNCDAVYMDCDPDSPSYKTDRRPFPRGDSTQGFKIAILAEADLPDKPAGACDTIQIVPYIMFGEVRAFNHCGRYDGIDESTGKSIGGSLQIEWQPGDDYSCLRFPDDENRIGESWNEGGTGPNCAMIEPDQWMTMRIRVEVVDWDEPVNRVQIFFALEGEPLREVIDKLVYLGDPEPFPGYGVIWFQMHSTNADTNIGEPDKVVWYRHLMVTT